MAPRAKSLSRLISDSTESIPALASSARRWLVSDCATDRSIEVFGRGYCTAGRVQIFHTGGQRERLAPYVISQLSQPLPLLSGGQFAVVVVVVASGSDAFGLRASARAQPNGRPAKACLTASERLREDAIESLGWLVRSLALMIELRPLSDSSRARQIQLQLRLRLRLQLQMSMLISLAAAGQLRIVVVGGGGGLLLLR